MEKKKTLSGVQASNRGRQSFSCTLDQTRDLFGLTNKNIMEKQRPIQRR